MKYSYILKNQDRILRPVTVDDAEFIVKLRNQPHVIGRINDTPNDIEKQREWIRAYLQRENEYYWIIETLDHRPIGTSSFYHYVPERKQMEGGRWVKMADAPSINEFANRVQMRDFAFEVLKLERLVCDVAAHNTNVLKFHRLMGERETHLSKGLFIIQGKPVDMIWFEETPETWARNRARICRLGGIDPSAEVGSIEKIQI